MSAPAVAGGGKRRRREDELAAAMATAEPRRGGGAQRAPTGSGAPPAAAAAAAAAPAKKKRKAAPMPPPPPPHAGAAAPPAAAAGHRDAFDLDGLFAGMGAKKLEAREAADKAERRRLKREAAAAAHTAAEQDAVARLEATGMASNRLKGPDSPVPLRLDADGLAIYGEEQLRINRGGNTRDCPFDCQCCF